MISTHDGAAAGRMNKPFVVALLGGAAVAAAIALNFFWSPVRDGRVEQEASPPSAAMNAGRPSSATGAANSTPTFDVTRVSPTGDAVLAGRGMPGRTVTILDGESAVGQVAVDENGEWVFVPEQALQPGQHRLTLRMDNGVGEATASADTVVLVVPEPGKDIAGREAGPGAQALALRLGPHGAAAGVLQAPSVGSEAPPISIGSVDHGDSGAMTVTGRATPGAMVQLYVDNALAGRVRTSPDGDWRMTVETPTQAERFSLRADEVTADGHVTERVAVPFSRGAGGLEPGQAETSIIVQPGANLWRIARRTLGSGVAYTSIYKANKTQILDPNLIFPGQVFSVPPAN